MRPLFLARVAAYVPLLLFVVLVPLSVFFASFIDKLSVQLLLALMAIAVVGVSFHLETRFSEELKDLRVLRDSIESFGIAQAGSLARLGRSMFPTTLGEAFAVQSASGHHVKCLRVFAISSAQILSFMNLRKLRVDKCQLLLRAFPEGDSSHKEFENQILLAIRDWQRLVREGNIGSLEIRSYDFLPTEYQVLFDDKAMVAGLYDSDPSDYSEVRVRDPILVDGSTADGVALIVKYMERFDLLFGVCLNHHGPDRYSGMSVAGK